MGHILPIHHTDGGWIKKDVEGRSERRVQGGAQQCFDWPHMRNKRNSLGWVRPRQLRNRGTHPPLHIRKTFTSRRRHRHVSLTFLQMMSIFRTARKHFSTAQSFPGAEMALTQGIHLECFKGMALCNGDGRLVGTLQRAAIHCCYRENSDGLRQLSSLCLPMAT